MASSKPRGRPPADGNFIVWTEPLVESLLRLRFEKYAEPMASAQGTKSLRVAWAELAAELTRQNNGGVMSVEQCRNKLKALRNKWLAYHSGMTSEPVCLALMDEFWGSVKDEAVPSKSQRQSRPSLEHRKQAKKPRVGPSSTSHAEERMDSKSLMSIAPAPAPVSLAVAAPVVAPVSTSIANPVQTKGPASKTASSSPVEAGTCTGVAVSTRAQLEDVALQTIARPKDPSVESAGLSKLGNLIDDRFAKVLECQGKQLKLAEEQNQLLARILATLQRNQHHDHT